MPTNQNNFAIQGLVQYNDPKDNWRNVIIPGVGYAQSKEQADAFSAGSLPSSTLKNTYFGGVNAYGEKMPGYSSINSSVLQPTPDLAGQISYPSPTPAPDVSQLTPPLLETPTEEKAQSYSDKLLGLNEALEGKSAYTQEQEKEAGIPQLTATQRDLQTQLNQTLGEQKNLQYQYNYTIPNQQQLNAEGRGITVGGLAPLTASELRKNQIKQGEVAGRALTVSALIDANAGLLASARDKVDRAVNAKYAPIEERINTLTKNLEIILKSPNYTREEKNRAQAQLDIQNAKKEQLAIDKENRTNIYNVALEAAKNGADAVTLQNIQNAKTPQDAIVAAGTSLQKPETQIVDANSRKLLVDTRTGKVIRDLGVSDITKTSRQDVSVAIKDIQQSDLPTETKNKQTITTILANDEVGQGTKTQLATVLGVTNAIEDMATARQTEGFKGISPLNAFLNVKIPFTEIGLVPFRKALQSNAGRENQGYIEAINLKVQQWASGAALTTKQTEQVARFTPVVTDTDSAVRTKLNNLYNFMMTQAASQLQSEGIGFTPDKVNLFEVYDLIQKATPEQLQELKDAGLIK